MKRGVLRSACGLALMAAIASGCAADKATTGAINLAEVVATKIAQDVPLQTGAMIASGRIQDPHYRIIAGMLNGVYVDIGLDGAYLDGTMQGQGTGGPVTQTPELRQIYADITRNPTLQERVFAAWKDWRATTQPSGN